jgi:N-acetylglucosamine-6-phosphate deacetylase
MILRGARVVTPTDVLDGVALVISGDTITELIEESSATPAAGEQVFDLGGGLLVPGYIDIHCHGGGGADFGSADPAEIVRAADYHAGFGTTSMLASLVSSPAAALTEQLHAVAVVAREAATSVVGVHLEGPFLSHRRRGAHNVEHLIDPDPAAFDGWIEASNGIPAMITVAPELPGALELIERAHAAGVTAAIGHTDATYDEAVQAFAHGARIATHLFNGMRPIHHREPGPVLAALDSGVACELINDGVHLHPAIVRMVADRDPAQVVLVTDAISATGLGDGVYGLGGQRVRVVGGRARVSNGSLAGSTLTMDEAVRRSVFDAGLSIVEAVAAATTNPARAVGLAADRGAIEVGLRADLVHLDLELRPQRVMRGGSWLPERD